MKTNLIGIFLVGFIIRLFALNQSLWLDEGTTARVIHDHSFHEILTVFSPNDFHPPLYYFFMKVWGFIFGTTEIALRLPSVLFSLLAGWFVYKTGKLVKNETTGLWSAAFFIFNPLIIYYSQEARMYSMMLLFLSAAFFYYIKILQTKKNMVKDFILFNLFIFLSFLTFYGSGFFMAGLVLYYLWKRKYETWKLLPGFIVALCFISPLLYTQVVHAKSSLGSVANWKSVLGTVTTKNALLIPLKFAVGRISFEPKVLYFTLSGFWTAILFYFFIIGTLKNRILLIIFLLPLFLGTFFSFISPLLQYFRFIYLIIPLSLAVALAAQKNWQKVLITVGLSIFSLMYLLIPQFHREDWKSLSKELMKNQEVIAISSSVDPLRYYRKDITINDIRTFTFLSNKVAVIPYTFEIYGIDHKLILSAHNYKQVDVSNYRGVSVELWSKVK